MKLHCLAGKAVALLLSLFTLALPVRAAEPNWPEALTVATGSTGGTYHAYGAELARLLGSSLGMGVAEQQTEGPSQNIQLIESGAAQIAFVTMGEALAGWNGTGPWTKGRQFRSMRAIFPMYDTPFAFAVLNRSPIKSLAELAGKRIGVGPQGGTAGTYIPKFLAALNLQATLVNGSYAELAAQLQAGKIDVLAAAAGAPFPALTSVDAKEGVRFIPLSTGDITTLQLAMPELVASTIPAGAYASLRKNYATVGLFNFAVARADLPEDLVFAVVEAVFKNRSQLEAASPAAAETIPANFSRNSFLPFHRGAMRYFGSSMTRGIVSGD